MTGADDIAIVIPAYNAGSTLGQVLRQTLEVIPSSHVIVVDDGSTDNTTAVAEQNGVKLIRHDKNRGKGAALKSGFGVAMSSGWMQATITMDADGQHAPSHIPEFIRAFRATAADLIIGFRRLCWPQMPLLRAISNRITSTLISWRLGVKILDSQSGYRLHSRKLLECIRLQTNGYEMESELLLKAVQAKMLIHFIPISTIYSGQRSHIRGRRDAWRFIRMWVKN
jgi:glycosyltransferase involved in cell wall biosynthesis